MRELRHLHHVAPFLIYGIFCSIDQASKTLILEHFADVHREPNMTSRASEYLSKIPFVTCSLIVLNCTVHIVLFFSVMGINQFAISADQVLGGEYYRIITSAFVHGGILHIFMNMSSLLALGSNLETKFGSLKFAFFTMWSILICGTLYVFLSW